MIIADTNVVSEFMKDQPDSRVLTWAQGIAAGDLGICVVTIQEIERGIGRLPDGHRRRDLTQRWQAVVDRFADHVAVYDRQASSATARILVEADSISHPMTLADAQIAGVCTSGGRQLATRNVGDFRAVSGLDVINPFE